MEEKINLKINPSLNVIFVVEGSAEKLIIETLVKEKRFIEEFQPNNKYQYDIYNVESKDKLTYKGLSERREFFLSPKEIQQSIFIIVGDDLDKNYTPFDKERDSKTKLKVIFGNDYSNRINYFSIIPESEILLVEKWDLSTKFKDSTEHKPSKFISNKCKIKLAELKSYKFWCREFNETGVIYKILVNMKQKRSNPINKKVILLKDALK